MSKVTAWDLGSTSFKWSDGRQIERFPIRTKFGLTGRVWASPNSWLTVARRLARLSRGRDVSISCQRSTFLLWNVDTGQPLTPLVSWQDTRGLDYARTFAHNRRALQRSTGLRLNGHYAGPKLWQILQQPNMARLRDQGVLRYGDLASWIIFNLTGDHVTGSGLAARTMLFDIYKERWCPQLCHEFGVSSDMLPRILNCKAPCIELPGGGKLKAVFADQSAAYLGATGGLGALVNLGTGGFVLKPLSGVVPKGFLTTYLGSGDLFVTRLAAEGTINGTGLISSGESANQTDLQPEDFCMVDRPSVGAPYWSRSHAGALGPKCLLDADNQVMRLEGVVFRVVHQLESMSHEGAVTVSGGLLGHDLVASGLATLWPGLIRRTTAVDSSLTGALSIGDHPRRTAPYDEVAPLGNPVRMALRERYGNWKAWITGLQF